MSAYWPYEDCTRCSGRAQLGSVDLLKYLMLRFSRTYSLGIYSCRSSSGGGGLSIHSCGRAIDLGIRFTSAGAPDISLGNTVVKFLNAHAYEFGIHGQIWNRVRYDSRTPAGRFYTGPDPHRDHNHIEQRLHHAVNLRFADYERIAGPAQGGTVPKYRGIENVPWDNSTNKPKSWAKDAIDDGIAADVINVTDDFTDDWERPLSYGALWTLLDRMKWPRGTRQ